MVNAPAPLPESMSRDEMLRYYSEYANMVCGEVTVYQKRIRDLQAVLQQALEALDTCDGDPNGYKGPVQWHDEQKVESAIKALRAALGGQPMRAAAKQPKCARCGGEGVIDQTGYGEYRPCPECNEDGSRPVHIR